jgi:flagellin-like hook-associated protein FlgL
LSDANDGVLLMAAALSGSNKILKDLEKSYYLAQDAALNPHSDGELMDLNTEFQALLNEMTRITHSAAFNGILLLVYNGSFDIPVNHGHKYIYVPSADLRPNTLNIQELELSSKQKAQAAFIALSQVIPTVKQYIHSLKMKKPTLEAAAKREAVITSFNLTGDEFIVSRTEAAS